MIMSIIYSLRPAMFIWCCVLLGPGNSDEEMHGG